MTQEQSQKESQLQVLPDGDLVTAVQEVGRFEKRISNLEKVADTIKEIAEPAIKSFSDYFDKKAENQRRQQEFDDKQHKRSVLIISFAVGVVFILCMAALLKDQFDLVKFFIQSGLAVAAGTGISAILKGRSKGGNGQNQD